MTAVLFSFVDATRSEVKASMRCEIESVPQLNSTIEILDVEGKVFNVHHKLAPSGFRDGRTKQEVTVTILVNGPSAPVG
jgi:hypothetical protein